MKRLKCIVLVAITLFVFTACSNQTFDNAKEKGLEALIEKNYSTAVSYFEIALEEKKDSTEGRGQRDRYLSLILQLIPFEKKSLQRNSFRWDIGPVPMSLSNCNLNTSKR